MTQWRVLPASARRRMPWKNGRGWTLELCSDAPASDATAWSWRLSIADVPEAGPFSRFEGVDRWIACVAGPGMRVCVDGAWHRVPTRGAALAFAGESVAEGEPEAAGVRDANLMVTRGVWRAAFEVVEVSAGAVRTVPMEAEGAPAALVVVHALDAAADLGVGETTLRLQKDETALLTGVALPDARLQVQGPSGRLLAAFLRPRTAD